MASQKISIITLGDGAAGKTSLLHAYAKKKFNPQHISNIGLDFVRSKYHAGNERIIPVKIWDTAG